MRVCEGLPVFEFAIFSCVFFDDFGEVGFHCGFVDVVGNFIWPEAKKSRCLGWW